MAAQTATEEKPVTKDTTENTQNGTRKQWRSGKQGVQSKIQNNKINKFNREIAELNGHVYEVHNEASKANQFSKRRPRPYRHT
jgi:hypothetical protein